MNRWLSLLLIAAALGCGSDAPTRPEEFFVEQKSGKVYQLTVQQQPLFSARVLKWHNGRRAAISLTYDAPYGFHPDHHLATDAVIRRSMRLDLEMVSALYQEPKNQPLISKIHRELLPFGIHFFGHGHTHALHDTMTFEQALQSFRTNFVLMQQWGLNPKVYAYPGSSGLKESTQLANRAAGFVAARGSTADLAAFYICPGSTAEPENWYFLPSVVMGRTSASMVADHAELAPILAKALVRGAWLILMYHAIGIPEGWGYYPLAEFERDLDAIAGSDFWNGNMDSVALYVMERNAFALDVLGYTEDQDQRHCDLRFRDGLDNALFDQPLTVEFAFAPEARIRKVQFVPPLVSGGEFAPEDNALRVDLVPDERVVSMYF